MRSPALALALLVVGGLFGAALATGARELEDERRPLRPGRPSGLTERGPRRPVARLFDRSEQGRQRVERHAAPRSDPPARPRRPRIEYRESVAVGSPSAGSLVGGVQLPRAGGAFFTWDPIEREAPNRPWRRWGTDDLVRTVVRVVHDHRREHPGAPRVGIGDLSRPRGGDFGPQFGRIGHVSHQNGLDADVYYPRLDGAERAPLTPAEVDQRLAQDLVDRFVAAGAVKIFVGPSLSLSGPPGVVVPLANHDNHLHVRLPA